MDAADAAAVAAPAPAPPPAAVTNANAVPQQTGSTLEDNPMTPEQQMDAIRRRIEQRRAQLREEAQQQNTQKTPAQ
jgi:general secretion pathway protein N